MYVAEITNHEFTRAGTGTKQFIITVKILGAAEEGKKDYLPCTFQYERRIFWSLTEKTAPFVMEKLKRLNFDGERISQLAADSPDPISLKGQQIEVWCAHEPGVHGGTKERWDVAGPKPVVMQAQPLSAKEMRELDQLFGKSFGEKKKPVQPIWSKTPVAADGTEITDEDVPF
jgi:hypothetical protein